MLVKYFECILFLIMCTSVCDYPQRSEDIGAEGTGIF